MSKVNALAPLEAFGELRDAVMLWQKHDEWEHQCGPRCDLLADCQSASVRVVKEHGHALLGVHAWQQADSCLAEAQRLVDIIAKNNTDEHGLIAAARSHVISARFDLEADLK